MRDAASPPVFSRLLFFGADAGLFRPTRAGRAGFPKRARMMPGKRAFMASVPPIADNKGGSKRPGPRLAGAERTDRRRWRSKAVGPQNGRAAMGLVAPTSRECGFSLGRYAVCMRRSFDGCAVRIEPEAAFPVFRGFRYVGRDSRVAFGMKTRHGSRGGGSLLS